VQDGVFVQSRLSAPNTEGIRTLATRENAGVFQRYEDAHVAIGKMPLDTDRSGLIFWVESADPNSRAKP
jgi:hypothetical protein